MDAPPPILRLLEYCVVENSNEAWQDLMGRFSGLIHRSFARESRGNLVLLAEFKAWLPGWLFYRRKIQIAYRWLAKRAVEVSGATEDDLERLFCSYFDKLVVTAVAEFFRERSPTDRTGAEDYLALVRAPDSSGSPDPIDPAVDDAVARLPDGLRVPLCLRFYPVPELKDKDFEWIVGRSGWERPRVLEALEAARRTNPDRKYPISSELIGEITGHSPDINGKYTAVDQAIRRALIRLHNLLKGT